MGKNETKNYVGGSGMDDMELDERDIQLMAVSYTHLRAHETDSYLVCRLLLEKKKKKKKD